MGAAPPTFSQAASAAVQAALHATKDAGDKFGDSNPTAVAGATATAAPAADGGASGSSNTGAKAVTITKTRPTPVNALHESVYALLPEEYVAPAKQKQYRSKFAAMARREYTAGQKAAASMGPAGGVTALSGTDGFLRKGEGVRSREEAMRASREAAGVSLRDRTVRKASVPKDKPVIITQTQKDFIKQNALENINSSAKKPTDNTPAYRFKTDYGRTPEYILKRREAQAAAHASAGSVSTPGGHDAGAFSVKEMEAALLATPEGRKQAQLLKQGIIPLPEDERLKILDGLKKNWEKLNSDYQKLSLTVDTVPKIA
ncbi:hypothetical protein HDU84_004728, partial [Entophlyctis sp. JEL0112]